MRDWKAVMNDSEKDLHQQLYNPPKSPEELDKAGKHIIELVKLIRDVNQHADERMSQSLFQARLCPNGYDCKTSYIQFWLNIFPRLLPGIWAAQQDGQKFFKWKRPRKIADQFADKIKSSLQEALDKGKYLHLD